MKYYINKFLGNARSLLPSAKRGQGDEILVTYSARYQTAGKTVVLTFNAGKDLFKDLAKQPLKDIRLIPAKDYSPKAPILRQKVQLMKAIRDALGETDTAIFEFTINGVTINTAWDILSCIPKQPYDISIRAMDEDAEVLSINQALAQLNATA